jgi:hypothetical protein
MKENLKIALIAILAVAIVYNVGMARDVVFPSTPRV